MLRAGGHKGVISDSSVGVLVEFHRWGTCGEVFSPQCAGEFGVFPCEWHRALQTQKGLGLSPVIGLCPLKGQQAKGLLLGLFNGTSGCVRSSRGKNNPAVERNLKVLL